MPIEWFAFELSQPNDDQRRVEFRASRAGVRVVGPEQRWMTTTQFLSKLDEMLKAAMK